MSFYDDDDPSLVCANCHNENVNTALGEERNLKIAQCGHYFCPVCVDRMFRSTGRARAGAGRRAATEAGAGSATVDCPACGTPFGRASLAHKTIEDLEFERENQVRARLRDVYNRSEADFLGDAEAYNAYLEMVESHVLTLVTGTNEEKAAVEAEIDAYRRAHASEIDRNRSSEREAVKARERRLLAMEADQARIEESLSAAEAQERARKVRVQRIKEAVLRGEMPASALDAVLEARTAAEDADMGSGPAAGGSAGMPLDLMSNVDFAALRARDNAFARQPRPLGGLASEGNVVMQSMAGETDELRARRRAAGGFSLDETRQRDRVEASLSLSLRPAVRIGVAVPGFGVVRAAPAPDSIHPSGGAGTDAPAPSGAVPPAKRARR